MRVALIGDFSKSDSPTGPKFFASEFLQEINKHYEAWFYRYNCSERPCKWKQKLTGRIETDHENKIITGGLLPLLIHFIRNKYEIVHIVNYIRVSIPFLLWAKFSKTKILYTLHGVVANEMKYSNNTGLGYKLKNLLAEKLISLLADNITGVSRSVCNKFREYYPVKIDKFKFLPPGLNINCFPHRQKRKDQKIRIITLKGMNANYKFLSNLEDIVGKEGERFQLTIIGDADESKSTDNIRYKTRLSRNEWISELTQHDIFINISRSETFSLAALEAFAIGLTLFLHTDIGITEYLNPGYDYNSYNQNDLTSLQAALQSIAPTDEKINEVIEARECKLKNFSIQEVGNEYILQYTSLVKR
ncbi:MAG: glycosyltransferase family 4 protein [Ignavibacteriaceae bacterium]|nr:glycosyltransferase family 4 protein [Ignavibacteriaceae bacterium]